MAVAFDAATESVRTGTTDPHTFTHTPVGTPRGVVLSIVHGTESTALVVGVTYGGVAMDQVVTAADTTTEPGRAYLYFLGSGIPTGPQTVSVDLSSATTTDIQFVCTTVTASDDTSVVDSDSISNNVANPSVTLQYGSLTSMGFAALYGGGASPANFTPNGSCSTVHDHDFGAFYATVIRQTTVSSGNFAIGGTAATDDVAYVALAVTDVTSVTVDLDTPNVVAGAIAAPATPEGVDFTVGPSAAVSTAACGAPQISNAATTFVTPTAAVATASVATPDGLDKAIGVATAAAAAAGSAPVVLDDGTQDVTVDLTGVEASATADVATPDAVDIHVGPSAAAAAAAVTAPTINASGGAFTTVTATAALAYAHHEDEPFPWQDLGLTPSIEVSVSPTAAAATAGVGTVTPQLTLGLSTRASATASGNTTLVGRPIQATAAAAAADGNVPTEVGDAVPNADVSPTAASATASVVAPTVSVAINAPQAQASGALLSGAAFGITVPVTAAPAVASVTNPEPSVTISVTAAVALAPDFHPGIVKTGSALVRPPIAALIAACDRPRSIGIKDFVLLIPRPSSDTRVLTASSAVSTLVLTPLEEQVE